MKAIILAAGRGSRMKELTDDKPKCMVKFKGRELLDWQVESLKKSGISEIGIVTGYQKDKIIHKDLSYFIENEQWQNSNMVFSLFCAKGWFQNSDFIVSYSDIFYTADAVKKLINSDYDIAITFDKNFTNLWQQRLDDPLSDLESFKIDKNGFLTQIGKKANSLDEIEGQFMGLLKFTANGWKKAEKILSKYDIKKLDCTSALQILIENQIKIKAVGIDDMWGEVDNYNDLKLYERIY